ncbi:MAG: 1-deoxy-D-xylulose-5-phosphate reductoisomerase [Geminicoccaceae bacterium]
MAVSVQKLNRDTPKRISIFGATGSVGESTLDLVQAQPERYRVAAVTAHSQVERLADIALKTGATLAVVADEDRYADLKARLGGSGVEVAAGSAALVEASERPVDWVMAGIVGAAGLAPTFRAIERGVTVALANKESMVCAGDIINRELDRSSAVLLPVDSEHNAIFQALNGESKTAVDRLTLTASGGPFRTWSREAMADVTPAQAVKHPKWSMGAKISIDSATMMNKGLELIEAHHLFGLGEDRLDVLVHPQSVIHSMVSFVDGSVLAQLGEPDMRIPIAYTLSWPDRVEVATPRLNLAEVARLDFEDADPVRFPAIALARQVSATGGAAPIVMNAANEVAVDAFLVGRIGFLDIVAVAETCLEKALPRPPDTVDDVLSIDRMARRVAEEWIVGMGQRSLR